MTEINRQIGAEPGLQWVDVGLVQVDNTYQRGVVPTRVRRILQAFRWRDFQPVTLADQGDGSYCVIDGQHRVRAAQLHPDVTRIPAAIVSLDGEKRDEAASFIVINTERTVVTPVCRYWAGLQANDPKALATAAVLEAAGCDVVPAMGNQAAGKTNAVFAVQRAIEINGKEAVTRALTMMRRAWPDDPKALKGVIIRALARVVASSEGLDDKRMTAVLHRQSLSDLSAHAEAMRKIARGSTETLIARVLADQYNKGRRTKRAYFGPGKAKSQQSSTAATRSSS